jgi:hypothetical protein
LSRTVRGVRKTFPKEGTKRDKQTIRELRALLGSQEKEIRFLKQELLNTMRPGREKVETKPEPGFEEWRKDFLERFKKEVLGK